MARQKWISSDSARDESPTVTRVSPPVTPGTFLRELLSSCPGLTQEELASAMGVTRYSVNQLANDRRTVTPAMALRLGKALNTSPEFWLNLQRHYDLHVLRAELKDELSRVRVVRTQALGRDLVYEL